MITPRSTRLLRVADLRAMHARLADRIGTLDPFSVRRLAVVVPTRGAAEALADTIGRELLIRRGTAAALLPDIVTRAELYALWRARLAAPPPLLSEFEREVLFRRAARTAVDSGAAAPFHLRPGLIPQLLAFYDELRRRDRTVADFARLMTEALGPSADYDRGADRLLRQTQFLSAAFEAFERDIDASGRLDEHGLRARLLQASEPPAGGRFMHRDLLITVADQAADPAGLWTADYDLFARMPGIDRIEVIATEQLLETGYHQRLHDVLPGIEEERSDAAAGAPVIQAPERHGADAPSTYFVYRDREEEMAAVARRARARGDVDGLAVVSQRPLPYLYLARTVFADARLPYRALDSLPLATEPFAAALDLVFTCAATEATRGAIIDLLGSPIWRFAIAQGQELDRRSVAALDGWLRKQKYLGGWERLHALATTNGPADPLPAGRRGMSQPIAEALSCAAAVGRELSAIATCATASAQFEALIGFIQGHERLPAVEDDTASRHLRARSAVMDALAALGEAHARYDDRALDIAELAAAVRRWIEEQTFSLRTGSGGITLLDAPAAPYADVDELRIVGLVESDWPDRGRRSILYPVSLLSQLGWPTESERLAAARARFRDLLRLPRTRLSVSAFTLEQDAIVSPSALLEEIETSALAIERDSDAPGSRVFTHEALADEPFLPSAVSGEAAAWLALRRSRTPAGSPEFHGFAGGRSPDVYAVSHVERYLDCPFKYFAAYVLRLDEERVEESGLTPLERGQLMHDVFERFFQAWHTSGRQAITVDNVGDALELFAEVAEQCLAPLSEVDRGLERTYLLGSAAGSGLAERAFAFEIEHGVGVVERLLEHPLEGEFEFVGTQGPRRLRIRAKADRIDLLEDGTLRVIDYKLGRAPKAARSLQLPIYGVCAQQHLSGRHGRTWTLGRAGYVAFKEKNAFVALGGPSSLDEAIRDGQERLLTAIASIERGDFPPDPDEPFLCTRCGYASVCRKDYVGDE